MKNLDLSTKEGRVEAMNQINQKALEELREIIELAPDTFVDAYKNGIEISLGLFSSDIYISTEKETRISCRSSGYFKPEKDAAYWRVIPPPQCPEKSKKDYTLAL